MPEFPETSESLIAQVRDASNRAAWEQFEQLYRPVIFRIARAKGLQHSDALDVVQQVLMSVLAAIGRYEPPAGGSAVSELAQPGGSKRDPESGHAPARDPAAGGTAVLDVLHAVPVDDATEALIDQEYRREVFALAAARVRTEVQAETWLAFEATVLQEVSIEAAAERLGMSIGSVYAARSRIMRRLRTAVKELEANDSEDSR